MKSKHCSLSFSCVPLRKVNKLLKSLKNSRSAALDQIDNFSLKVAADIIDSPVQHIINMSIIQQKFPSSWKFSKVIPLHKKLCKLDKKNYRPVSILSPLSKILEKVIYQQVYNYFDKNKIFNPNMHGYRHGRSTETALLSMYDRWVKSAAGGQFSGAIVLDLSSAFDLVDPSLLLQKLKIYGLEDDSLEWINTYLTGRFQAVWLDHVLSDFLETKVGVPQGSNLGPLFFLIFFNDLSEVLENSMDNYADDTTLTASGSSIYEIETKLTSDCSAVSNWMLQNKLKLNPDKTHATTLSTEHRLRHLASPLEVLMDGVILREDPNGSEVLLGCHIQANLKWDKQVSAVIDKLNTRLTGLRTIQGIAPFHVKNMVIQGVFNSIIVYCLPLYGGIDKGKLRSLQLLQNKAARIATSMPRWTSRDSMFSKLGWLTVQQLIFYHTALSVFKIRKNNQPEYLATLLNQDSRNGRIMIPNLNLQACRLSFTIRGADTWNQLPRSLRDQNSLNIFKKSLKKWVKLNISRFPV